ncbi:MAG TPA: hypothetical protein VJY41_10270 [Prolixibacteraceae bacterium]|nr:hypothetical protein [Prolixibacteraceae bacterium]
MFSLKAKKSSENSIIHHQHAVHFLTFTVTEWIDVFTRANYKIEIANALEYCQKNKELRLFAYCLITNYLHLVCPTDEPYTLSEFVHENQVRAMIVEKAEDYLFSSAKNFLPLV